MGKIPTVKKIILSLIPISFLFSVSTEARVDIAIPFQGASLTGGQAADPAKRFGCLIASKGRLALASLYGTCRAPNIVDGNQPPPTPEDCDSPHAKEGGDRKSLRPPGGCGHGGQPEYSQEGARMKMNGSEVEFPGGKTDCSGFVSGVVAGAGGLLKAGESTPQPLTTAQLVDPEANSLCFEFGKGNEVNDGDLIVWNDGSNSKAAGHVVVITGKKKGGNCTDPATYEVSESAGGGKGPMSRSLAALAGSGKSGEVIKHALQSMCSGGGGKATGGTKGGILRHTGYRDKNCMNSKAQVKFKGESCVQSCPNTQSPLASVGN